MLSVCFPVRPIIIQHHNLFLLRSNSLIPKWKYFRKKNGQKCFVLCNLDKKRKEKRFSINKFEDGIRVEVFFSNLAGSQNDKLDKNNNKVKQFYANLSFQQDQQNNNNNTKLNTSESYSLFSNDNTNCWIFIPLFAFLISGLIKL